MRLLLCFRDSAQGNLISSVSDFLRAFRESVIPHQNPHSCLLSSKLFSLTGKMHMKTCGNAGLNRFLSAKPTISLKIPDNSFGLPCDMSLLQAISADLWLAFEDFYAGKILMPEMFEIVLQRNSFHPLACCREFELILEPYFQNFSTLCLKLQRIFFNKFAKDVLLD